MLGRSGQRGVDNTVGYRQRQGAAHASPGISLNASEIQSAIKEIVAAQRNAWTSSVAAVSEPSVLAELARREPDDLALEDDKHQVSWAELDRRTHAIGWGLLAAGASPGDHVGLVCSNRTEFVEVMLACFRAGLKMTPIKTNWTATEIAYVLDDAGSALVVADTPAARDAAGDRPVVWICDDFDTWVNVQDPAPFPAGGTGYRIPYTSGTTGRPKGVERTLDSESTFEQWWEFSSLGAQGLGLPRDGKHLMVAQLFHGAPLAFALGALANGAPMRIMARWDAERAVDVINDGVTATIMVPTMFRQLLALSNERKAELEHTRLATVLHGGEPCPVPLKQRMIDWWGPILTEYYGFTEGGMTMCISQDWLARPGTVGTPIGELAIQIVGDNGEILGPREPGTVYFRRPEGRYFRYINADDKTDDAYNDSGFFSVGDIGYLDEDGYLYLSGRSSEVIVAAGVNIYPAEIEDVVFAVDGVADACAVGGPDPDRGEQVVVYLAVSDGFAPDDVTAAIDAACNEHLAGYKRPRRYIIRPTVDRDPTGKVLRTKLRDELWP